MFRRIASILLILASLPVASGDIHDVRISLPQATLPFVPDPEIAFLEIDTEGIALHLAAGPETMGYSQFRCGNVGMPTANFGFLEPIMSLRRYSSVSTELASMLGRPDQRKYEFTLVANPQRYALQPDALGYVQMYPLESFHY